MLLTRASIHKRIEAIALVTCIGAALLFGFTNSWLVFVLPLLVAIGLLTIANYKIIYWLLLLTLPLSIQVWFFNDAIGTSLPDEPLMITFMFIGILLFAHKGNWLPDWFWRNKLTTIVVIQYLWMWFTCLFTYEPVYSLKFAIAKTWFLFAFFLFPILFIKDKKHIRRALLFIMIGTIITALIIFFRHAVFYKFSFRYVHRSIYPLYFNHVDYSGFLSMVYPFMWVVVPFTRKWPAFWRWVWVGLLILFIPIIYVAYARAAVLAVTFAGVMYIAIKLKLAKWVMPSIYAVMILIISYMASGDNIMAFRPNFEKTYMRTEFIDHLKATISGTDMSSMERIYRWIGGVRMSADEPITGYGPGAFYNNYKSYTITSFRTWVSRNSEGSTTHNYFLMLLTEQGWPAMLLYAIFLIVFFAKAQNIYHQFNDKFYKAATMGVAMCMAASFVNNFFSELIETHKMGGLFYLCIAVLILLQHKLQLEKTATVTANKQQDK